jgi:hypothetical protein
MVHTKSEEMTTVLTSVKMKCNELNKHKVAQFVSDLQGYNVVL